MRKATFGIIFPEDVFEMIKCVMAAVLVCRCVHVYTYLSTEETDPFFSVFNSCLRKRQILIYKPDMFPYDKSNLELNHT